jgi:hypothetical protein
VGWTSNDPVHELAIKHQWGGVLLEPVTLVRVPLPLPHRVCCWSEAPALRGAGGAALFASRLPRQDASRARKTLRRGCEHQRGRWRRRGRALSMLGADTDARVLLSAAASQ